MPRNKVGLWKWIFEKSPSRPHPKIWKNTSPIALTHTARKSYPSAFQNTFFFEKVEIVLKISRFWFGRFSEIFENPGSVRQLGSISRAISCPTLLICHWDRILNFGLSKKSVHDFSKASDHLRNVVFGLRCLYVLSDSQKKSKIQEKLFFHVFWAAEKKYL